MQTQSEKHIQAFFQQYLVKKHAPKTIVLGGEMPQGVMYIQSGYIRRYILSYHGVEQTTLIFGPHDIFPLVWAISGKENTHRYFQTLTDAAIHYAPRGAFISFVESDPSILHTVFMQTIARYDDVLQRISYISLAAKARTKILALLLLLSRRFQEEMPTNLLPFPLTHMDIAGCLGVSRETVSIAIKKLLDQRVLRQKNRQFGIQNIKKLLQSETLLTDLVS